MKEFTYGSKAVLREMVRISGLFITLWGIVLCRRTIHPPAVLANVEL